MTKLLNLTKVQKSITLSVMAVVVLFGILMVVNTSYAQIMIADPCDNSEYIRVNGKCVDIADTSKANKTSNVSNSDGRLAQMQEQINQLLKLVAALQEQIKNRAKSPVDVDTVAETKVGSKVQTTDNLRVRFAAGTDWDTPGSQPAFSKGTVIDGPRTADGHTWWKVDYDTGHDGWSSGKWLKVIASDTDPTPDGSAYDLAAVKSVTASKVDPIPKAVDDEYTIYKITLLNGKHYEVKAYGFGIQSAFHKAIRDTGYVGDIDALLAKVKDNVVSCPLVLPPRCDVGARLYSNGQDAEGCSLGYKCVDSDADTSKTN